MAPTHHQAPPRAVISLLLQPHVGATLHQGCSRTISVTGLHHRQLDLQDAAVAGPSYFDFLISLFIDCNIVFFLFFLFRTSGALRPKAVIFEFMGSRL
ncbi:hypothetical protein PAHAL_9G255800 [Panicum hallii]|uniref:Uncharacterized protein n=1 Tax=Panicum hallii TaxID=206008 RepID=A0A2T8I2K2_9POAL|nr:hypothetical protein PAHAL_9G255800 [Panicum hallii]